MKKFIFILIPALLLSLVLILTFQYIVKLRSQKGALQVTSVPESKVYLDNKYLGQTPLCKCEASDMLKIGDYTIRLVPLDKNLTEFQEKVTVSEAALTVVDRKFGKDSLSEGSVISLSPLSDKKKTELLIVSFPEKSTVWLDSNVIGDTPKLFSDPTKSDHVLKVKKNGYNEKTVRIQTPLGYKLTVAVYLSTSTDSTNDVSTPSASPSANPSLSISPTGSAGKVIILQTPTGFLRVRDMPSMGATEVGRVSPGETYPLVDDQAGWFEIKLTDGTQGWVSSQYVQKQ